MAGRRSFLLFFLFTVLQVRSEFFFCGTLPNTIDCNTTRLYGAVHTLYSLVCSAYETIFLCVFMYMAWYAEHVFQEIHTN